MEVLARDWRAIEGFTAAEAHVVSGNALNHPVRWKGNDSLARLVGQEIRGVLNAQGAQLGTSGSGDFLVMGTPMRPVVR